MVLGVSKGVTWVSGAKKTHLTKLLFNEIPALASKMEEWLSPLRSVETRSSSV